MEKECPKCGETVVGEDLGDHPAYISFYCDCGHDWSENIADELQDRADRLNDSIRDGGFNG